MADLNVTILTDEATDQITALQDRIRELEDAIVLLWNTGAEGKVADLVDAIEARRARGDPA